MNDDLQRLETWVAPLLQRLKPADRARLARNVGTALRRSQQKRIAAQRSPDRTAYAPRKASPKRAKAGRVKRGAMFVKLRQARHLRTRGTAAEVVVGFSGRVSHIARIHQEGRQEAIGTNRIKHVYARRQLLGFTSADEQLVRDLIVDHLRAVQRRNHRYTPA